MLVEAFVYDGARTAFGRHGGVLSSVRPDTLLAAVLGALIQRNPFDVDQYEDVIIGNANQSGEDARNVARFAALLAGLPVDVAGVTVNRLCGSSLSAIADAGRCINSGQGQLLLAGGVESMSRAPMVLSKAVSAFDRRQTLIDTTIGSRFTHPEITASFGDESMPETAENIAADLGISRDVSDAFAARSQACYQKALNAGYFDDEIIPVEVAAGRGKSGVLVTDDEHPRAGSTIEALEKLRPLNTGGVVTAGSASGINDGAAALIVGSARVGEGLGLRPRVKILSSAVAGVPPRTMGLGPVPAITKVLKRCGLTIEDMDVIEINEAFAVQVLGCLKTLGLDGDDVRVNPNGGAIAVGHPLGASGARLLLTAMRQLERTGGRFALVSLCIGVGQGVAMIIERVGGN